MSHIPGKALVTLGRVLDFATTPAPIVCHTQSTYFSTSTASPSQKARIGKTCSKCGGSGFVPRYGHIAGGLCFQRKGSGVE